MSTLDMMFNFTPGGADSRDIAGLAVLRRTPAGQARSVAVRGGGLAAGGSSVAKRVIEDALAGVEAGQDLQVLRGYWGQWQIRTTTPSQVP